MDGGPAAAEVLRLDHGNSRVSGYRSRELMSWQQAPRRYHGTLAPQRNPTSSGLLRPDLPMFLVQPVQAQAQVGKAQQAEEVGMVQVKAQVAGQVIQPVQGIPRQLQVKVVQAQGWAIFRPELRPEPRELLVQSARVHWYAAPQQAAHRQAKLPQRAQQKELEKQFAPVREREYQQQEQLVACAQAIGEVQLPAEWMRKPARLQR
jgi:hypothetical protein